MTRQPKSFRRHRAEEALPAPQPAVSGRPSQGGPRRYMISSSSPLLSIRPGENRGGRLSPRKHNEAAAETGAERLGAAGGKMCNDFGNRISYRDYVDGFSELKLPVRFDPPAPNF